MYMCVGRIPFQENVLPSDSSTIIYGHCHRLFCRCLFSVYTCSGSVYLQSPLPLLVRWLGCTCPRLVGNDLSPMAELSMFRSPYLPSSWPREIWVVWSLCCSCWYGIVINNMKTSVAWHYTLIHLGRLVRVWCVDVQQVMLQKLLLCNPPERVANIWLGCF